MVRLSGPAAVAIGRRLFCSDHALGTHPRRVEYGEVCDREGRRLDTALAWALVALSCLPGRHGRLSSKHRKYTCGPASIPRLPVFQIALSCTHLIICMIRWLIMSKYMQKLLSKFWYWENDLRV